MSRRLSYAYQINKFIQRFPDLCVDGPVIKCRVCEINLLGWSAYQCKRHVESQTHKKNRLLQLPYWVLHCVAEVIRNNYQAVDNLISSTAKIFLKSPQRIKEFHKSCPGISEPPQPISTRSGTWLKACFYYSKYFHDVKSVIFKFDPSKSHAIRECQQMYEDPEVVENLHTIQDKYSILRNVIDQLEDGSIPLDQSFQIVDNVNTVLQNLTDVPGTEATSKFNDLLQKNLDLPKLGNILQSLHEGNAANDLDQYFKYANITSLDVERSFSKYVALFADKRMCLKEATTEAILMIQTYAMVHHSRATK
ncbi:uncharacterized protein LOC108904206 isoform X2 [Anoplophora glabripennis]|uniref:uncharacterized protein LOC108904206 isoform X2 n=1 Tax=Anoplophora glabripennis TaxID=217634 RepID=UPI000874759A|nr:uncharacterized protein LOC108904206 isoform X2 [Anoplophora glabripennis]